MSEYQSVQPASGPVGVSIGTAASVDGLRISAGHYRGRDLRPAGTVRLDRLGGPLGVVADLGTVPLPTLAESWPQMSSAINAAARCAPSTSTHL